MGTEGDDATGETSTQVETGRSESRSDGAIGLTRRSEETGIGDDARGLVGRSAGMIAGSIGPLVEGIGSTKAIGKTEDTTVDADGGSAWEA